MLRTVKGDAKPPTLLLPTTVHKLKTWVKEASTKTGNEMPVTCDRKLNIGLMFLEPLLALALNINNN